MIRKQAVVERELVEKSLARLVAAEGGVAGHGTAAEGREKRELAYWSVLGLGRVADE